MKIMVIINMGEKKVCFRYAGNCLDKTSAFVTLLRAVNIPVRYVLGDNFPSSTEGHAWAQVCFLIIHGLFQK